MAEARFGYRYRPPHRHREPSEAIQGGGTLHTGARIGGSARQDGQIGAAVGYAGRTTTFVFTGVRA